MSKIERKVLGALLILCDKEHKVHNITIDTIANAMGYKKSGGAISFALKILEYENHIAVKKNADNTRIEYIEVLM